MSDDILPPLPPGQEMQESVVSVQKQGLFSRLFAKKKQEQTISTTPTIPPAPITSEEEDVPEPEQITQNTLDGIRKQLGLDKPIEIPEPAKIDKDLKKEEKNIPQKLPVFENIDFTKDVDEPPKIIKAPVEKLEDKAQAVKTGSPKPTEHHNKNIKHEKQHKNVHHEDKQKQIKAQTVLEKPESTWTNDVHAKKQEPVKSAFDIPIPSKIESNIEPKKEFISDVKPEEVKALANNLKRKQFDESHKITPAILDEPTVFNEEKQQPITPAKEIPVTIPIQKQEAAEEREPTPSKISKIKDDIRKELRAESKNKIRDEVRVEEKEKLKKEYEQKHAALEKDYAQKHAEMQKEISKLKKEYDEKTSLFDNDLMKLANDKSALEQEKIATAGKANKYEFKEKQLIAEKKAIAEERVAIKRERNALEYDKEEAQDLIKKIPLMRKDYESLSEKMKAYGEQIKLNMKLEENIKKREESLKKEQSRLREMEEKIKSQGFATYLETELNGKNIVSQELEEPGMINKKHPELYNMIDDCKSFIWDNRIEEAKTAYMKLREEYKKSRVKGDERDQLFNTIRELYDDITIAQLK